VQEQEIPEEIIQLLASAGTSRGKPDCTGSVMRRTDLSAVEYTRHTNNCVTVPTSRQQAELFRQSGDPNRKNKEGARGRQIQTTWSPIGAAENCFRSASESKQASAQAIVASGKLS